MSESMQQEYIFDLEGGATYVAVLEDLELGLTKTPAFHMYSGSGKRLGRPVIPEGVQEIELYLLMWVSNWDARLYRKPVAQD